MNDSILGGCWIFTGAIWNADNDADDVYFCGGDTLAHVITAVIIFFFMDSNCSMRTGFVRHKAMVPTWIECCEVYFNNICHSIWRNCWGRRSVLYICSLGYIVSLVVGCGDGLGIVQYWVPEERSNQIILATHFDEWPQEQVDLPLVYSAGLDSSISIHH
jgi:hypothetical protein